MRLIVWDFDGTLVDSWPLIEAGMAHTVDALGMGRDIIATWRQYVGLPVEEGIRRTFPLDDSLTLEDVLETYRTFPHAEKEPLIHPFPGIPELLDELLELGIPMALATSKRRRGLNPTLLRLGWQGHFDPIITPDEVAHGKPHPESLRRCLEANGCDPEEAVMVGDTPFDLDMATAMGVPALAVGYGMYPPEALRNHGARAYAPDVPALRDILLAWREA